MEPAVERQQAQQRASPPTRGGIDPYAIQLEHELSEQRDVKHARSVKPSLHDEFALLTRSAHARVREWHRQMRGEQTGVSVIDKSFAQQASEREQTRARYPDETGYVERDGIKVFWERYGDREPTAMFLPTWSVVHSRTW